MQIEIRKEKGFAIALLKSSEILLCDVQSVLDLLVMLRYEAQCDRFVLSKESVAEAFFDLHSHLAGEILQKLSNYRCKCAIVGDFSQYASKALKNFIYESNRGNDIFFVASDEEAVKRLSQVRHC
ncbi:MAG: DUF4180 domain-containing protein [Spirochaetia bacterium]|nr:DUF4180 domain-containing protein [Spirochaetia bacterium]